MAYQQNGYTYVPHSTYDEFRDYALNHGVNVDYSYGNQCWDICALLWYQYGLTLRTGPEGYAYECWTVSKDVNASPPFVKITNITDVKRGDIVVFNKFGSYSTGHIGFSDSDYTSGSMKILGQNEGQGTASGTPSIVANYNPSNFIGAFRNTNWYSPPTPPTPPSPSEKREGFPWVLYANKLRLSR